jgi:hypothetical protein
MKFRIALGVLLAAAPLAPVSAMPVSTFLAKAEVLQRKGPLAMFSGDLRLLMRQIKTDAAALRGANDAAAAAGRPKAYCTPPGGVRMGNKEVMAVMQAVPVPQRATTSTKDALRAYFVRRYPCGR